MLRIYGIGTAAIGLFNAIYNALWIRRVEGPFDVPDAIVLLQLVWAGVSLVLVVRQRRRGPAPILPSLYIFYTAFAVSYTVWLGTSRGTVTDAMTPLWWKIGSLAAGMGFFIAGLRMAARSATSSIRSTE